MMMPKSYVEYMMEEIHKQRNEVTREQESSFAGEANGMHSKG